ncbi:alpha/beta hydrolase [Nocardia pseudobrasiliensis]|uniref:Putative membrane protein n=1 Tax=Nocardia pseudobrasiliensis TaxID=45979 RepID=A0A370I699_9NOCA|nr:alpha/beta-hydrolase family protein [Nocardia pseudobrasiliensis]RDI66246.1 putative membrane protein [Nocardia pseudobrasiliensis]
MLDTADVLTTLRVRGRVVARRGALLVQRVEHDVIDLNYVGLVVATVFFAWSVTPSLLPRDWLFQGLISGLNAAIGYGVGCVLEWLFRRWVRPRLPIRAPALLWQYVIKVIVLVLCVLAAIWMLVLSADWQRQIFALMDMEGTTRAAYLRTGALSLAVGAIVVAVYRTVREIVRFVARQLSRWVRVPSKFAPTVGSILLVVLVVTLFNGLLTRAFFAVANSAFSVRNDKMTPYAVQPTKSERSGSADSFAAWETLGSEGRWFVSHGPDAFRIGAVSGAPAREPIRVYAGLDSAKNGVTQEELALAELERTHAFDRKVLVVVTTTGTGWVNSETADAIEYLYRGDTAIVASQYSYLPSVLSFLADRQKVAAAGKKMFDAVYAAWSRRPADARPKLVVYGESLGSQGSESAFDGLADLRGKVDAALWVGPPNSNRLWEQFVSRRDPGTREVEPIYADGLVVRFASTATDLGKPSSDWRRPRIAYLQHASDPIVWWSPNLIFSQPDWLSEQRGSDVSTQMRWWPLVTFWQVAADLTNAQGVSDGHGHNYGTLVLDGWCAVLPPPDLTPEKVEAIRTQIELSLAYEHATK